VPATANILLDLLLVFAAAKLFGEVFERLRLPAVVGEIIAGIVIGPYGLGLVRTISAPLMTLSLLGIIVLRFVVGLETKPSEFFRVGPRAFVVAILGVALSFAGGIGFGMAFGFSRLAAIFVGTAIVSTSVGVTARVLKDRGIVRSDVSRLVLAAAVIDDVLGLLLLAVVMGSVDGGFQPVRAVVVAGGIVLFLVFELWIAPELVKRHAHLLEYLHIPNAPFVVAIIVMLATAAISEQIGLAAVIGGFLAGMMLAETEDRFCLVRDTRPLYDWLVPYFFAMTGMSVRISLFRDPRVLALGIVLTLIAVAAKVVGCGLGAWGRGLREMIAVGVGMIPRAEVPLVVAAAGVALKIFDARLYAVLIFVVVASLLLSPPLLALVFASSDADHGSFGADRSHRKGSS
jgi:Kef-type K+ transport system membrane component KefB